MIWTDNCCIPMGAENPVGAMMVMDWYYDPEIAAALTEYNNYVSPVPAGQALVEQHAADATGDDKAVLEAVATSPFVFPTPEIAENVHSYRALTPEEEMVWNDTVPPDLGGVEPARARGGGAGKRLVPYGLLAPAGLWQLLFFIIPMVAMLTLSLSTGTSRTGYQFNWAFSNYPEVIERYGEFFVRSFRNAAIVTVLGLVIGYPAAYWIAFHGGRRKATFLLLLLLPFFVSFVIRTFSWGFILSDEGFVLGTLKNWGILPDGFSILNTTPAVIAGITYNLLPFAILPLFVSLDRIDKRLVEAAGTSTPAGASPSARWCSRSRSPACSPRSCSRSSRPPVTTSTPRSWAAPRTR